MRWDGMAPTAHCLGGESEVKEVKEVKEVSSIKFNQNHTSTPASLDCSHVLLRLRVGRVWRVVVEPWMARAVNRS
jgi:hypothetical protein